MEKIEILKKLISGNEIKKELRKRKLKYQTKSIEKNKEILDSHLNDGWELIKEYKKSYKLKKLKKHDIYFEDKIWTLFALLGFNLMNKDRYFKLPYDKNNPELTQQIDVFAKDDETILLIECKSTNAENKKGDFKKELEALKGKKAGLLNTIKKLFPDKKYKIKFIFATNNYALSEPDNKRLENLKITHFNEETINYFFELYKQLGNAAKYQFLGYLFEGQVIPELDNKVPAIRGKMGGHTYFSFSIEPEKLLKIGYVLHRNKANINMMPTYQRLIKKNRLKGIQKFIDEEHGYFPNSIIINIDTEKKKLQFEQANTQVKSTISDLGILYLPKKYRSAFIIDGQHRLYGYANSEYKSKNTIPVVAFVNLDRSEQVKLFMDINENQKSVSKNLRITLNADLLWNSSNYKDQINALSARLSIVLGEDRNSPLFNKISIGEDKKIITQEAIVRALKNANYFGNVTSKTIEKPGTFYKGNIDEAFNKLSKFLILGFEYIKENTENEWNKEDSIIVINKGIYALIRIFSDIVDHLIQKEAINSNQKPSQIFSEVKPYLDPIIKFFKNMDIKTREELKTAYGGGGDTKYWRKLQLIINKVYPEFNPKGLGDYIQAEKKEYNEEAFKIIRDIETYFKKFIKNKLIDKYGDDWFEDGVPPNIQDEAVKLAQQKKRELKKEQDPWDNIHLINYREIVLKNWKDLFDKSFTRPSEKKLGGDKKKKTEWMVKLNKLRNKNFHTYSVTKEEIEFLRDLKNWLIKDSVNKNL